MKIPEQCFTGNIAVLGKNGAGKTYAAKAAIVEPLLACGARVGIVDPTGAWWGLRTSKDGKSAGFKVLVLGGDHGDMPLTPNSGPAVARLLAVQGVSLIADTTQMMVGERTRWFTAFAGELYKSNRTPLHLVLDEAHNFAPQGRVPDPDAGKMLHASCTLAAQGRSRGIRLTTVTQRPQKLHKDVLTTADTLIAMRVIHPLDRAALSEWIKGCGVEGQGETVMKSLANLERGEGWCWYPEGGFLQRGKFPAIKTFDSSATPTDGDQAPAPKGAATIDLAEIQKALADAAAEMEANDPKLLRARIAELEKAAKKTDAGIDTEKYEQTLKAQRARGFLEGKAEATNEIGMHVRALSAAFTQYQDKNFFEFNEKLGEITFKTAPAEGKPIIVEVKASAMVAQAERQARAKISGLTAPQQRILDALAWLESVNITEAPKIQLALLADTKHTSSGYQNNLGALRTEGMINYPSPGKVQLTAAGRGAAIRPKHKPTTEDLHAALRGRLSGPRWRIIEALIDVYPRSLSRPALASRVAKSETSSGYQNDLGALRSLGFLDYPQTGHVAAEPVLFLGAA